MVESCRESLNLKDGQKIYENLVGDSEPTKNTSNVVSGKNSFIQNT